jgi:hypothetical protein
MLKTILLRRLVGGIFILWLVSVLVFAAIHLLPGNAATILVGHSDTTPQEVASLTRQLGLAGVVHRAHPAGELRSSHADQHADAQPARDHHRDGERDPP